MSDMCEIIRSTLEAVKDFTDSDAIVGNVITTPSGVSLIPISKITVGFVGGGADYGQKRLSQSQSFGGGSGAGISISPIAFLSVSPDASVSIIPKPPARTSSSTKSRGTPAGTRVMISLASFS